MRGLEYKDMVQQPMTGRLDVRSLPDQMPEGSYRFRLNMTCSEEGRLCRMAGWEKFLSNGSYKNQDLHDQLLSLQTYYEDQDPVSEDADEVNSWPSAECSGSVQTRSQVREVPTLGMQVQSSYGSRRLVVGTQSRLYVLNETTGNYRLLGDGYGGPADSSLSTRFYGVQLGDNVFFTNNYDIPCYWPIDGDHAGCAMRATKPISDLELIGLTKAAVIAAFNGTLLLANVVQDGQRYANRIYWSDYNDGTSFDPAVASSITGYQDLDPGEEILALKQLGVDVIAYTKTSIWIGSSSGQADASIIFKKVYSHSTGDRCLAYRNTLISTGPQHIYAGRDGFYVYDTYKTEPELVEWMHPASGVIFNGVSPFGKINEECCDSHVAELRTNFSSDNPDGGSKNEIWFSWAESGSCLPSKTIVFNIRFQFVSLVDHGFTMFVNYNSDTRLSLRDWILRNCFCDLAEEDELNLVKEPVPPAASCPPSSPDFVPASIYSESSLTRYGITTENWDAASADGDSLCALLGPDTIDSQCGDCNPTKLFVACSATDYCLKQIGTAFSRERCSNASSGTGTSGGSGYTTFTGTYVSDGYYSVLISRPNRLGTTDTKSLKRVILEAFPVSQVTPCVVMLRVGYSYNAYDPMTGYNSDPNVDPTSSSGCGVLWRTYARKSMECPLYDDPAAMQAAGLAPGGNEGFNWPTFVEGRFIYFMLIIASLTDSDDLESDLTPAVGGECCFTSLTARTRIAQKAKL